jgi:hypothetical protein
VGGNKFFGFALRLTSVGAVLLPASLIRWNPKVLTAAALCWRVAGALFVLISL